MLNTVTVDTDKGSKSSMRFVIDTGAIVCLVKCNSLKEGTRYDASKSIQVRGISVTERTLGSVTLKLFCEGYEAEHDFQEMG
jgi:hypothetical protein